MHSKPITMQISLLNKFNSILTDDEVRYVMADLPKPYSEIKTGYNSPRLDNSSENRELVTWLKSRKIISSWKEDNFFTDKIKVNLCRS